MCLGAALWARLDTVYYAATTNDAASVGFDDQHFHEFFLRNKKENKIEENVLLPITRIAVDEYMLPFHIWNSAPQKRMYWSTIVSYIINALYYITHNKLNYSVKQEFLFNALKQIIYHES